MTKHAEEVVPFSTDDGRTANVIHILSDSAPSKGPVLLVHGAGVRANIFQAPVATTLVDDLVAHGWDVWLENWRASIDFPPCEWTLDQAAVYDHPRAVETVIEATGADTMQAVIHCQGSTSFMMSAVAGLVPQVTTIVSNAVALHPIVPPLTKWKQILMTPVVSRIMPYLDPQWEPGKAPGLAERAVALWVEMSHRECHNQVCKMVSFSYGMGHPTLWSHENLNDETHNEWLRGEFGHVPLSFFRQILASERAGHLVSVDGLKQLPADFVAQAPETDARFAFLSGARNHCFLPESQQQTFEWFDRRRPDYHSIRILPCYGHLDVFMGQRAAKDVFPLIRQELSTTTGRTV
jgi:pimeloyl-ACP methyl ester carboxylesterase